MNRWLLPVAALVAFVTATALLRPRALGSSGVPTASSARTAGVRDAAVLERYCRSGESRGRSVRARVDLARWELWS